MSRRTSFGFALAVLAAVMLSAPGPAAGQERVLPPSWRPIRDAWSFDVAGGAGLPGAVIDEELRLGPAVSVGVSRLLGGHFAVRGDLDVAFLRGRTESTIAGVTLSAPTPDRTLYHFMLGLEIFFAAPWEGRWWASGLLSVGGTSWSGPSGAAGRGPWFTGGVGVRAGRLLARHVGVWAGVRAYGFVVRDAGTSTVDADLPLLAGVRIGL